MKASSVAVHIRVPTGQVKMLERAARAANEKLATYVRRVALERANYDLSLDEWMTAQKVGAK